MQGDLSGQNFWRYQKNVSPSVQEYIEALSYAHYMASGRLVSHSEVQMSLCSAEGLPYFPLDYQSYLLGVSDLSGELMRLAIVSIAQRERRKQAYDICRFVRSCHADFERWSDVVPELDKKQDITNQNLIKIEGAAYALSIRSSESGTGLLVSPPDTSSAIC
ncbi:Translin [Sistotremastrum niveocremeum HHB9708]|uniref:Translin n=1 Tax=Sistotremastrum niveocremeum HHB9708 TaxID=1314777 RepID=A0A164UAY8_9AGAM|nr:Translin [Sistotremastrum niveocremeum HHB9708]